MYGAPATSAGTPAAYAHKSPGQGHCIATPGWPGRRDGRKSIKSKIIDTTAADSLIVGNMPYLRWTASPAKNISNGRAGAMHNAGGEFPRIPLPRTRVNSLGVVSQRTDSYTVRKVSEGGDSGGLGLQTETHNNGRVGYGGLSRRAAVCRRRKALPGAESSRDDHATGHFAQGRGPHLRCWL